MHTTSGADTPDDRLTGDELLIKSRTDELDRASDGDHRRRAVIDKVQQYLVHRERQSA